MTGIGWLALAQIESELAGQLDRIAWSQMIMAASMVLILLIALGVGVVAISALRSARRFIRRADHTLERLGPRADPLLERAARIAGDAHDISDTMRRRTNELMDTVSRLNESLQRASHAAEERVRDFVAVLDVVQEEAERLLIDTTAAARGLHTTAESLRRTRPLPEAGARTPAGPPERVE